MTLHALALRAYKHAKAIPFVGRAARQVVSALKTTFAAWHYSQNRLRGDFVLPQAAEGPPRPLADPAAETARLSRRVGALEGRAAREAAQADCRVPLELRDADGLVTRLDWHPGLDIHRIAPHPGFERAVVRPRAVTAGSLAALRQCIEAVDATLAPGGSREVECQDPVLLVREAPDLAAARVVAGEILGLLAPSQVEQAIGGSVRRAPGMGIAA